ncbi:MAG: FAD-dependent oxidoreductase [Dehalococcoidia bacterium]|nr:FAD-dependent oxidoreductase [Dehalococcoidia bacterium]
MPDWDLEADVIVAGSGGAGLTAAVLAHDHGARVVVLERSDKVGGTTAVSGGGVWVPMNHHMHEVGATDSRDEALAYCKRLTAGRAPDELVETFVDTGHQMVRYLEERTPLDFKASAMPDYRTEEPGAKQGGRTLQAQMFAKAELGEWEEKLRPSPLMFVPLTIDESMRGLARPQDIPVQVVVERMKNGLVASGNALIGRLLKGCLDRGITIDLETRARELVRENGRVVGLRGECGGRDLLMRARGGVVLACAGFEWNDQLRAQFLPGPITQHCSPPYNEGDGLVMAAEVGADLANMSEAWVYPGAMVPGEEHEGQPVSRWVIGERSLPHSILVNRYGERFVNEGVNYNDISKAFQYFDPQSYEFRNLPCWAILDRQYRAKYAVLTVMPGDPDPDWLTKHDTLAGLAAALGIDGKRFAATAERWNCLVREGKDTDFGRGESAYEHWLGDPEAPHPNLGTIERPPFYALPIHAHSAGTKGGPRTNAKGEVLSVRGDVIPGLYAAGNTMAGISGPGYYGGGGTIGLAMTWGYLCGINAAQAAKGG